MKTRTYAGLSAIGALGSLVLLRFRGAQPVGRDQVTPVFDSRPIDQVEIPMVFALIDLLNRPLFAGLILLILPALLYWYFPALWRKLQLARQHEVSEEQQSAPLQSPTKNVPSLLGEHKGAKPRTSGHHESNVRKRAAKRRRPGD